MVNEILGGISMYYFSVGLLVGIRGGPMKRGGGIGVQ